MVINRGTMYGRVVTPPPPVTGPRRKQEGNEMTGGGGRSGPFGLSLSSFLNDRNRQKKNEISLTDNPWSPNRDNFANNDTRQPIGGGRGRGFNMAQLSGFRIPDAIKNMGNRRNDGPMGEGGGPPKVNRPSLGDYLSGDSVWQGQKSLFQKTLEDFIVSNNQQKGRVNEDFDIAMDRLGEEREDSLDFMESDFGARGILNSGLYGGAVADYNDDFQDVVGDLNLDKTRTLEDLINELAMFQNSLQAQEQSAQQEAVRRYAEQFGVLPVDNSTGGNMGPITQPTQPQGGGGGGNQTQFGKQFNPDRKNFVPTNMPNATWQQIDKGLNARGDVSWQALRQNQLDGKGVTRVAGLNWEQVKQMDRDGTLERYLSRRR